MKETWLHLPFLLLAVCSTTLFFLMTSSLGYNISSHGSTDLRGKALAGNFQKGRSCCSRLGCSLQGPLDRASVFWLRVGVQGFAVKTIPKMKGPRYGANF